MRTKEVFQLPPAPVQYSELAMQEILSAVEESFSEISRAVNGGLGFGDGNDIDNIIGKWLSYTTNGAPDTEDELTHNIGQVPVGVIVMLPPQAGFIYRGPTAWTTSKLYLKCSAAAQTVKIFILAPSSGLLT